MLLCVVVVPSLGLVWFMRQAVENERLAVRQKLIEVYRAQLSGVQRRLNTQWARLADDAAARLDRATPAAIFAATVRAGAADAVVCFDAAGNVTYPAAPAPPSRETAGPDWIKAQTLELTNPGAAAAAFAQLAAGATGADEKARALQAQARCLLRAGEKAAASDVLNALLQDAQLQAAGDAQGRLIAPNAALMAIALAEEIAPAQASGWREHLRNLAVDYERVAMPATQRRFLLRELQQHSDGAVTAPLLAAEELAAAYVDADEQPGRKPPLRATAQAGVWQQASQDGRVVLLHREENLAGRLGSAIGRPTGLPADVRLEFIAPGREPDQALISIPAGAMLPGWRLALALHDPDLFDTVTSARVSSYLWIVVLVVLLLVVLAALAGGLVRRQIALTRLRNDLVANVTHELKTPLASMRLLVETLLEPPVLNEQTTREYLQLIATENRRLSRLIGNFLTFSRIERNKLGFDFQEVAAAQIVENAAAAMRDRLSAPDCRFTVEVAPSLPRIRADADALVTALINLLENAWKYSGPSREITLSAEAPNGTIRFAVRDNGVGISPRDVRRIFRRFEQVQPAQPGGGVGLGLSIVKFIVAAHQGTVHVSSEPGRGSTFAISLPLTAEPQTP